MTDDAAKKPLDDQPWTQQVGENNRWYQRFSSYLALGPMRSVREVYRVEKGLAHSKSVPASWSDAYHRFKWAERAKAYDDWRRREVFSKGNAADAERVKKLDKVIDGIYDRTMHMLEHAPKYEEKFNGFIIDRLLTAMDLMAKHTGGYVERHEVTGKDGGKIEVDGMASQVFFYLPQAEPTPTMDLEASTESEAHDDGPGNDS